jgi:hypothetical protein
MLRLVLPQFHNQSKSARTLVALVDGVANVQLLHVLH